MVERLEIQSLLLAARWSCRRYAFADIWEGVRCTPVQSAPLVRPFATGARIEALASKRLGPDSCLPQAIATTALLRRHGHSGALVLGVRGGQAFQAHAWVELHGIPLVGGAERAGLTPIWRGVF